MPSKTVDLTNEVLRKLKLHWNDVDSFENAMTSSKPEKARGLLQKTVDKTTGAAKAVGADAKGTADLLRHPSQNWTAFKSNLHKSSPELYDRLFADRLALNDKARGDIARAIANDSQVASNLKAQKDIRAKEMELASKLPNTNPRYSKATAADKALKDIFGTTDGWVRASGQLSADDMISLWRANRVAPGTLERPKYIEGLGFQKRFEIDPVLRPRMWEPKRSATIGEAVPASIWEPRPIEKRKASIFPFNSRYAGDRHAYKNYLHEEKLKAMADPDAYKKAVVDRYKRMMGRSTIAPIATLAATLGLGGAGAVTGATAISNDIKNREARWAESRRRKEEADKSEPNYNVSDFKKYLMKYDKE